VACLYLGHALEHDDRHAEDDGHEQRDVERSTPGRVCLEDDLVESMSPAGSGCIGHGLFYFSAVQGDFVSRPTTSWPAMASSAIVRVTLSCWGVTQTA
jgi:hypothetical protein